MEDIPKKCERKHGRTNFYALKRAVTEMLSPEVWNFKAPQHHFSIEKHDYEKNDVPAIVSTHYFNHSVSVILPDTARDPNELRNCISEDSDYYRINAINVSDLVNKEFIEAFIKKGELSLLTIGNKVDVENSIAITPSGQLIISLLTKDFQKLGLEGKPSFFDHKIHTRYVVTIDLKSESFTPGKKNYERVRTSLRERLNENFDVIIMWNSPDEHICPSSVAAWFHEHGYTVSLCHQTFLQKTEYSLTIPTVSENCVDDNIFEWLGVFSISGDLTNEKEDNYVNTYICPSPSLKVGQVQYLQWTGFFTTKQIEKLYKTLTKYIITRGTLPWTALHVQGFFDSPISFNLKEHTVFTDGDNSFTILFQNNGNATIRKSISSNNKPRIFQ